MTNNKQIPANKRYEIFLNLMQQLSDVNEDIQILQMIYDQTQNELAFHHLSKKKRLKEESYKQFWEFEDYCRQKEIEEFWRNPGKYPDAVRDWFIHYREKELS